MRDQDIEVYTTYLFVATESPARKYLEGQPFEVVRKERVFRRGGPKGYRVKVWRYFNADGVGARADELGELDKSCHRCRTATQLTCGMCHQPTCEACTSRPESMNGRVCLTCDELPF
jgi:hypothetical protein